jgi:hypothetical protein
MHGEDKVPEPTGKGKAFPSTVPIKTNGAIDQFLPKTDGKITAFRVYIRSAV